MEETGIGVEKGSRGSLRLEEGEKSPWGWVKPEPRREVSGGTDERGAGGVKSSRKIRTREELLVVTGEWKRFGPVYWNSFPVLPLNLEH